MDTGNGGGDEGRSSLPLKPPHKKFFHLFTEVLRSEPQVPKPPENVESGAPGSAFCGLQHLAHFCCVFFPVCKLSNTNGRTRPWIYLCGVIMVVMIMCTFRLWKALCLLSDRNLVIYCLFYQRFNFQTFNNINYAITRAVVNCRFLSVFGYL